MDLSVYSPASLPNDGDNFVGHQGLVSGKQNVTTIRTSPLSIKGWGSNGIDATSVDNLTEASVDIVASGNCLRHMNLDTDGVDSLIVCASSANQGPCKVNISNRSSGPLNLV